MAWVTFIASSIVLVVAATKLAEYGDVIAVRTRLGGLFVGTLLLAGATSLPELLTTISSVNQGAPNLAAGNLLGSCMFNMLILALLDLVNRKARILRQVALRHALSAGLAILLLGMTAFFLMANIDPTIGWVGIDSLLLVVTYIVGVRLIQSNNLAGSGAPEAAGEFEGVPSLRRGLIGFAGAAAVLVAVTPLLVRSSKEIAELTGLGTGFVGTTLLAMVTSLPELVTTIAAVRLGAFDMAVGNLFGSNAFNIFALGLTDLFFLPGRFLGAIDPAFALVALLGLLLTSLGQMGNLARVERRFLFFETDALIIIVVYFAGMWFLYTRGLGV
ncbi:MAG: sodium:calcium antiporter [Anaerolineae bacterium]|nr:sodium:calcium antiporter [Anaerolineae bacterium]